MRRKMKRKITIMRSKISKRMNKKRNKATKKRTKTSKTKPNPKNNHTNHGNKSARTSSTSLNSPKSTHKSTLTFKKASKLSTVLSRSNFQKSSSQNTKSNSSRPFM